MPIIEVKNLVKKYKKATTNSVDDVSFSVDQGEFFAFLGPNGAGKTTTISILTTTLAKTSGEVFIDGLEIDKNATEVRKKIGVIFQNPSLDLNLTAEENVRFHAALYGLYSIKPTFSLMPKEYQNRVLELAEVLDLKSDIFKPISGFSGGMKRKLEIIRTLMHEPKVLFLDEPSSGLDPLSRKNLWIYLDKIRHQKGTTLFLTTHYLDEAEGVDNVCVLNKGKVVMRGTPKDIKSQLIDDYVILFGEDKSKLEAELRSKKVDFVELDHGGLKLDISGHEVQDMIKSIDTRLKDIRVVNPTLEEAYLEIISPEKEEKI